MSSPVLPKTKKTMPRKKTWYEPNRELGEPRTIPAQLQSQHIIVSTDSLGFLQTSPSPRFLPSRWFGGEEEGVGGEEVGEEGEEVTMEVAFVPDPGEVGGGRDEGRQE